MSTNKVEKRVNIDRIKVTTYVRAGEDAARIEYFYQIIMAGGKIEPIQITDDYQMIDGRNRMAAMIRAGRKEIMATFEGMLTTSEIIFRALKPNTGGAKQADEKDIEHVIKQLIKLEIPKTEIIKRISEMGIPGKYCIKIHNDAISHLAKEKLREAAKAVFNDNLTVKDAAKKYSVNEDSLKVELGHKKSDKTDAKEFGNLKQNITQCTQNLIGKVKYNSERAKEFIAAGLLDEKQIKAFVDHLRSQSLRAKQNSDNWADRIEAEFLK